MNDIFRFRKFPVYIEAREFRKQLKNFTRDKFPKEEMYCLTSQLWRALDSILLNIAEGSDRYSDIDFSRFLNNSLTSVNEVTACLDCALDDGYVDKKTHETYLLKAENLAKQLKAFSSSVRNKNKE
ncbi:MAG: four helix bundle protein [Candidatus Omnitrophica bacterium]|nr:four helix bundle protein [Candidatus Omnitrophota bacterium]